MNNKELKQNNPTPLEYPQYLSNRPQGIDLFEGQSQEQLADAICTHITETDKISQDQPIFARLIGLEGKWGSGKSNVIRILENKLIDHYTFFTFDAWGNQEDLQRRSILELLTRKLISKEKLTGPTKRRCLKPIDGAIIDEDCTWDQKLESLLSRKSYTRNVSIPSFNNWSKIFVLMLLITGMLIPLMEAITNDYFCWWGKLLIIIGPITIFIIIALIFGKLKEMWAMYNTSGQTDTKSYVISEQEPSVREFKDWMGKISSGLEKEQKLVLVFDNMDRLPSEKVHQFWSLIQTFFADDGYENIWCIVPYDEQHLASVFNNNKGNDNSIILLRGFLNKTFPVIYRVPEPIVLDYKVVFEELFHKAFGTTVKNNIVDLISQCYRYAHPTPNVREIITFVNNNVMLTKQWGKSITPISRAIFILKEDALVRNPEIITTIGEKQIINKVSTDEYILNQEYLRSFNQILYGNVDKPALQREIAALTYGIDPKKADQIVIKRYIRNSITHIEEKPSISKYIDNPHFMPLLLEDVQSMDPGDYNNAVLLINDIDSTILTESDKNILDKIWQIFANRYYASTSHIEKFSKYEHILFSHINNQEVKNCAKHFCKRLIDNNNINGGQLYTELTALFEEDFAKDFDKADICPQTTLDPKRFVDFVLAADFTYKHFPFSANSDKTNQVIEESIGTEFPYLRVLELLKGDTDYSVSDVGDYAVDMLNQNQYDALTVANYIAIQRIFFDTFQNKLDLNYISSLWNKIQSDTTNKAYNEIYALMAVESFEPLPEDDTYITILKEKIPFYTTTSAIIQHYFQNPNVNFRRNLLKEMITENICSGVPNYQEFIEQWQKLVDGLGIERATIINFADKWGYQDIPKDTQSKPFNHIFQDATWIDALLSVETPLTKALLKKCVQEMSQQPITQFVQGNSGGHTNTYWDKALQKLIDTEYITEGTFSTLLAIAKQLLNFAAINGTISDPTWNSLLNKVEYASISSDVSEIRNNILIGRDGYTMTPEKFKFLHKWLELAGINLDSHQSDAADNILSRVVDDTECQNIILDKWDYYKLIITNTITSSSALHDRLKIIIKDQPESKFTKYIKSIVSYPKEKEI